MNLVDVKAFAWLWLKTAFWLCLGVGVALGFVWLMMLGTEYVLSHYTEEQVAKVFIILFILFWVTLFTACEFDSYKRKRDWHK